MVSRQAFAWMNQAMLMQQLHYDLAANQRRSWTAQNGALALERPFVAPDLENPVSGKSLLPNLYGDFRRFLKGVDPRKRLRVSTRVNSSTFAASRVTDWEHPFPPQRLRRCQWGPRPPQLIRPSGCQRWNRLCAVMNGFWARLILTKTFTSRLST
jgi:hypothetical protein